jgi:hypothetical protein
VNWTLPIIVFASMAFQDTFNTVSQVLVNRRRYWLAGPPDGLTDWGQLLSVGVGGASVAAHGFSSTTVAIFAALMLASCLSKPLGGKLGERLERAAEA